MDSGHAHAPPHSVGKKGGVNKCCGCYLLPCEEQESVGKHEEVMDLLNNMSRTFVSATIMIGPSTTVQEIRWSIYYGNLIVTVSLHLL